MTESRRKFIKNMTAGTVGISLISYASGFPQRYLNYTNDIKIKCLADKNSGNFPFAGYIKKLNIGEYLPKDQGGKFIQMEILGSEEDQVIVEKIKNGLLQNIYGNPIDWGKLEDLELEKSVWLNRFYYLPSFARMYYLTNDKTFLDFMMMFIRKWLNENQRLGESHSKYNWSDMQVAWRAIHLSWCYFLGLGGLTDDDKSLLKNALEEHATVLLSDFGQQPLNEFNHQSHAALAMLYLGVLFPTLPMAKRLIETSVKILNHHISHAFYADGGNIEQMFGYYPFEAHIFRDTYLLCKHNQIEVPEALENLLHKMVNYLILVAQPDETMPQVNDSYEMPVAPTILTISDALGITSGKQHLGSCYFPDTQIAVIRSGDTENNAWYLLLNPARTIGAHAHAGRLGFNLWYNNRPIIVDSGCCNYDNPLLVNWYRTTQAHNTVLIDGKSDEASSSPLQWAPKRTTANRISHWIDNESFTYCRMISPGNETVNSAVTWNRSFALVHNKFLVLHDYFASPDEHNYELLFHFNAVPVSAEKNKSISIFETEQVAIIPANKQMIGNLVISEKLISRKRGNISAPMASYQFNGKGTLHAVLIFIPKIKQYLQIKIEQRNTAQGIGIMITEKNKEKTVLLIKNTESDELNVFGYSTKQPFDVF